MLEIKQLEINKKPFWEAQNEREENEKKINGFNRWLIIRK